MGTLTGTLTDQQNEWLSANLSAWYGVENCTVAKYSTWTYFVVLIKQPGTTIVTNLHVNNDGTTSFSGYQDISSSTYWRGVFEGTDTVNMYYYYINHGDNKIDSYITLTIPDIVYNFADKDILLRDTGLKIFEKLKNYCTFIYDSQLLDDIYINSESGDKYASKLLLSHLSSNGTITPSETDLLARTLFARYGHIWESQFSLLEYGWQVDPLENYHRTEEHSESDTETETPTNWAKTNESLAAQNVESEKNKVYGFNSASAVNESENEKTFAHKNTETQTGSYERKTEYGHKIETYGNIGVNPAEALDKQREFLMWDLFQVVFNDIDSLLTKNYIGGLS